MKNVSRRRFLAQSSALASVAFIPNLWTLNEQFPSAPRKIGPNEKVNLALCGIGFQGGDISKRFFQSGFCLFCLSPIQSTSRRSSTG